MEDSVGDQLGDEVGSPKVPGTLDVHARRATRPPASRDENPTASCCWEQTKAKKCKVVLVLADIGQTFLYLYTSKFIFVIIYLSIYLFLYLYLHVYIYIYVEVSCLYIYIYSYDCK